MYAARPIPFFGFWSIHRRDPSLTPCSPQDRVDPCTPCIRAGLRCVFPMRAPPRARSKPVAKTDQIAHRLSRLEGLVSALGGEDAIAEKARERGISIDAKPLPGTDTSGEGLADQRSLPSGSSIAPRGRDAAGFVGRDGERYLGHQFWSNLSVEVSGVHRIPMHQGALC